MRQFIAIFFALLGFAALYAVLADVTDMYAGAETHGAASVHDKSPAKG